jgi:hypothetical protein
MPSEARSRQIKSGSSDLTPDTMEYGLYDRVFSSGDCGVKPRNILVAIELLTFEGFEEDDC